MGEMISYTPLRVIQCKGGDVLKLLSLDSPQYAGFGEVYFSKVECHAVKAWKRHKEMTLNLAVPVGKVEFVFYDDRIKGKEKVETFILGEESYHLLTVPPGIWFGFRGLSEGISVIANCANMVHRDNEVDRATVEEATFIPFNWRHS